MLTQRRGQHCTNNNSIHGRAVERENERKREWGKERGSCASSSQKSAPTTRRLRTALHCWFIWQPNRQAAPPGIHQIPAGGRHLGANGRGARWLATRRSSNAASHGYTGCTLTYFLTALSPLASRATSRRAVQADDSLSQIRDKIHHHGFSNLSNRDIS